MLTVSDRAAGLLQRYQSVRGFTEEICRPLLPEDFVIQSMPDASPPKWHLGHTTWFFEKFLLEGFQPDYRPVHPSYNFLFNSYYESVGQRQPRPRRGMLARPPVDEVFAFRSEVDRRVADLLGRLSDSELERFLDLLEIGLHHEQQHQELLFTDVKHNFACNPLLPEYLPAEQAPAPLGRPAAPLEFLSVEGGIHVIGCDPGGADFAYDNESPAHRVYLNEFRIANRPVTNGEYAAFLEDGGYQDFRHWLSDAWARILAEGWEAPLYWRRDEASGAWMHFTLYGLQPLDPAAPVAHLSYYEALAFAQWAGKRLPTETEWEVAAARLGGPADQGAFARPGGALVPLAAAHPQRLAGLNAEPDAASHASTAPALAPMEQAFGDVWEWTGSAYLPYPGYRPLDGALGEYNGKFMSDQMVLRGGSCATPKGHARLTYRNFFQPYQRWQFSGVRLAEDA